MKNPLFEEIVVRTGLSPIFAGGVVTRVCAKAKIDPAQITKEDLKTLLPLLKQSMSIYLKPEDLARQIEELTALAG